MNYYEEIKKELINNEVYKKVKDYSKNKHDLMTYYNVGKLLIEAQGGSERAKYGDELIKEYSKKLLEEKVLNTKTRILWRCRKFFILFYQNMSTLSTQLSWSHYVELLKFNDINIINYDIEESIKNNLSVRELRERIKSKEYERLDDKTKNKLINKEETSVSDYIPNPIIIKNNNKYEIISEKVLKNIILENIDNFLSELGNGFLYAGNEYKIKIGSRYNYIDLLLFNYIYNAFVIVELKVTEFKKEHIGQIQVYMNYVDKNIKKDNMNNTIGLIICKKNNKFVLTYTSDSRIEVREYKLIYN